MSAACGKSPKLYIDIFIICGIISNMCKCICYGELSPKSATKGRIINGMDKS